MIERFAILDSDSPRPEGRILFCDGTGGGHFREGDLELSHWRPNRTPPEYRAGTSTEICFRFLDQPRPGAWTVAVNNHVDVDGILSVYVLVHRRHALAHRQTILEAAAIGDFWGWGEPPAQRLFQGLTWRMQAGDDGQAVYDGAFRRIPGLIDGTDPEVEAIEASLRPLRRGVELVEAGDIARRSLGARLTQYILPRAVAGADDAALTYVPEFNEAISDRARFWPQARARWDAERVCLVSSERSEGWFHDLWAPGYLWADTEGLWRIPGLTYDGMGSFRLDHPPLIAAFEQLQRAERSVGTWGLSGSRLPFGDELQERFPLLGRFLDEQGNPAVSRLSPDQVALALGGVFD